MASFQGWYSNVMNHPPFITKQLCLPSKYGGLLLLYPHYMGSFWTLNNNSTKVRAGVKVQVGGMPKVSSWTNVHFIINTERWGWCLTSALPENGDQPWSTLSIWSYLLWCEKSLQDYLWNRNYVYLRNSTLLIAELHSDIHSSLLHHPNFSRL